MAGSVELSTADTIKAKSLYEAYRFRAAGREGVVLS